MRRRSVLTGSVALAGGGLSAPAVGQGRQHLVMVTDWPDGPGLLGSATRLAANIAALTDDRLKIEVFAAGELVEAFEAFDAVQADVADMFHTHLGYYRGQSTAFDFYSGLPFGLTSKELFGWVRFGGGQAHWDRLCAEFNVKPLACASTGAQMGGWYNSEITSTSDFSGLRYRMAGPGAEVYRRLGAAVVLLAPADIVPALNSGAIDAAEWSGPWLDRLMGLDQAASHYYYPGWHEPGSLLTLGMSTRVWNALSESERTAFVVATEAEYITSLAEFDSQNAAALRAMREDGRTSIESFPDTVLRELGRIAWDVLNDLSVSAERNNGVAESYLNYLDQARSWSAVTEGALLPFRNR